MSLLTTLKAPTKNTQLAETLQNALNSIYNTNLLEDDEISSLLAQLLHKIQKNKSFNLNNAVELSSSINSTSINCANLMRNLTVADERTDSMASAIEEMSSNMQEVSSFGNNLSNEISSIEAAAQSGYDSSIQSRNSCSKARESVEYAKECVDSLVDASNSVSHILVNITDIADKTNLLAINAKIEAASAGEAGKSFTVVADEVKELAKQSRAFTTEIEGVIKHLLSEVEKISSTMTSLTNSVKTSDQSIEVLTDHVHSIKTLAQSGAQNTKQIAIAIHEQTEVSKETSKNIITVSEEIKNSVNNVSSIIDSMDEAESLVASEIQHLAQEDIPNKIIKIARSDHIIWKKRLANMMVGREGLKSDELADHHTCRLGKWYDAQTEQSLIGKPAFQNLVTPHELVHKHGKLAVDYYNNGELNKALEEIQEVEKASQDVLRLLHELED